MRMLTGSLEPALFRRGEKPLFFHRKINSPVVICATLLHHLGRFSGKINTGSAEPTTGSAMGSYVIAVHNPAFRPGLLENHAGSAEPVAGSGQVPGSECAKGAQGSSEEFRGAQWSPGLVKFV